MTTTRIIGTGRCVPEKVVTNDNLAEIMDTSDEWIYSRTGIRNRHIAIEETTTGMAAQAAKRAMENAKVQPEDIDLILVGTVSGDTCFPSTACNVQREIGAVNAVAYDISAGCTGFIFALHTAHAFITSGMCRTALVIGAETLSKMLNWEDRSTCVLFGDGAGAAVIQADDKGMLAMVQHSDGAGGGCLKCDNRVSNNPYVKNEAVLDYLAMNGQDVFKFAVRKVPECIVEVLDKAGLTPEDVDHFILHQANARIIQSVSRHLKVDLDKFPMNMNEYGNTSAASIPILLDELVENGTVKSGDKIVMAGFGAGLTWGACVLEL